MPLLNIVQDAAVLVGLSRPSAVASATDLTTQQLMTLATEAGEEVQRFHDWSNLQIAGVVTGTGATTDFALPADFDRFAHGQKVILDGGIGTIASGPLSPAELTSYRARSPITVAFVWYRRGNTISIAPPMVAGRNAFFEYITQNWVLAADGSRKARFTLDDDTVLLPSEDLVKLGIIWKWRRLKGFDYAQEYETWRQHCQIMAGRDRSLGPVAFGPALNNLPEPVTPDTILVTGG